MALLHDGCLVHAWQYEAPGGGPRPLPRLGDRPRQAGLPGVHRVPRRKSRRPLLSLLLHTYHITPISCS